MTADRLLTPRDVAELLRVHPKTVLRYVRTAGLPCVRLPGGDVRLRRSEVDRWLDRREAESASEE
jgi:excisionase family DNA binding protein